MKLIMTYVEFCYDRAKITIPIEYESKEALIFDFMKKLNEPNEYRNFSFGNETFNNLLFEDENLPEFFTLEEWFETNNIMKKENIE